MRRWTPAALLAVLAACSAGEQWSVPVNINTKLSCGFSLSFYDLTCLSSLETRLVGADGAVIERECTSVQGRYANVQELTSAAGALELLRDISPRAGVYVELRGYLANDATPCTNLGQASLLLWGRSSLVDLSEPELGELSVVIECRPGCDCADIEAGACEVALQTGICAPPAESPCRRACDEAAGGSDCYGGALRCEDSVCAPAQAGGLCGVCDGSAACVSGLCVTNTTPSINEQFCSTPCPEPGSAETCPAAMSCKRADQSPYALLP